MSRGHASVRNAGLTSNMAKKRVSSVELTWIIVEQMKEDDSFAKGLLSRSFRFRLGWRAVVGRDARDEFACPAPVCGHAEGAAGRLCVERRLSAVWR